MHEAVDRVVNDTVRALVRVAAMREKGADLHSARVAVLAVATGEKLGMSDEELLHLRRAAELHDIGKVAISENILGKLGRLSEDEIRIMRQHATLALEILSAVQALQPTLPSIKHHHERWDGTGYPDGLTGEQIPLGARIIAVAEVYDILRHGAPWKEPLSVEEAKAEIQRCAGTQFDPRVVEAFLQVCDLMCD
ncbi:MAG: HD-GYP domain-containing protein [Armatimonadota bacterium]|nr:HD-GYP domain-containing protein [bacterium]MDW8320861.1 HD-GYP domain-containing protein [Armatimonadota bacterium]